MVPGNGYQQNAKQISLQIPQIYFAHNGNYKKYKVSPSQFSIPKSFPKDILFFRTQVFSCLTCNFLSNVHRRHIYHTKVSTKAFVKNI